jgi:hypothetical protein
MNFQETTFKNLRWYNAKLFEHSKDFDQNSKGKGLLAFENITCISIFIFFLAVYTKTLCPTVFWWDSGELIANIAVLGISHRPSFPVYVLLGRFFSFIPFGTFAFKVNFLSSLFASFSLAIFFKIFLEALNLFFPEMAKRKQLVLFSAFFFILVFGFTYSFWIQAVRAEVYSLNALFFSLLLLMSILYVKHGNLKYIHLFFFLFGLGLGNHHLSLLSSVPALLFLILFPPAVNKFVIRRPFQWILRTSVMHLKRCSLYVMFFLSGLSIYLYLPVRSLSHPPLAWGEVKSLSSSANSIFALDTIKNLNFGFLSNISNELSQIFLLFSDQLTFLCFAVSLVGVFLLFRHNRRFLIFLLLLLAGNCAVVVFITTEFISTNPDLHGYLIFSLFSLAFFYGIGVFILLNYFRNGSTSLTTCTSWFDFARHKSVIRHFPLVVFGVISLSPMFKHYQEANLSHNWIAHNYGLSVISDLDSNSVLFADNVNLNFILRELRYAEKIREDVTVIDRGLLSFDWYVKQKRSEQKVIFSGIPDNLTGERLFAALLKRCQDLYESTYMEFTERDSSLVNYLVPKGYVFKVSKTQIDRLLDKDFLLQAEWDHHGPFDPQEEAFQRDWDAQRVYALSFFRLGLFYEWKGMTSYALDKFSEVRKIDPENEELILKIKHLEAL